MKNIQSQQQNGQYYLTKATINKGANRSPLNSYSVTNIINQPSFQSKMLRHCDVHYQKKAKYYASTEENLIATIQYFCSKCAFKNIQNQKLKLKEIDQQKKNNENNSSFFKYQMQKLKNKQSNQIENQFIQKQQQTEDSKNDIIQEQNENKLEQIDDRKQQIKQFLQMLNKQEISANQIVLNLNQRSLEVNDFYNQQMKNIEQIYNELTSQLLVQKNHQLNLLKQTQSSTNEFFQSHLIDIKQYLTNIDKNKIDIQNNIEQIVSCMKRDIFNEILENYICKSKEIDQYMNQLMKQEVILMKLKYEKLDLESAFSTSIINQNFLSLDEKLVRSQSDQSRTVLQQKNFLSVAPKDLKQNIRNKKDLQKFQTMAEKSLLEIHPSRSQSPLQQIQLNINFKAQTDRLCFE